MHARLLGSRLEQVADSRAHYVGQGRVCWRRAVRQRRGAHDCHDCYALAQTVMSAMPLADTLTTAMPLAMQDRYCRALQSAEQHTG